MWGERKRSSGRSAPADVITWDDAGLIQDFTVMVRPAKALRVVIEHMGAELMRMLLAHIYDIVTVAVAVIVVTIVI